jgi:hypothetical protein
MPHCSILHNEPGLPLRGSYQFVMVSRAPSQGPEFLGEVDREPSLWAHPDEHVLRVFVRVAGLLDITVAHFCAEVPVGEGTKIALQIRRLHGNDGALHADILIRRHLRLRPETEAAGTREQPSLS